MNYFIWIKNVSFSRCLAFLLLMNPQTSKYVISSWLFQQNGDYNVECFLRILSSIKISDIKELIANNGKCLGSSSKIYDWQGPEYTSDNCYSYLLAWNVHHHNKHLWETPEYAKIHYLLIKV